MPTDKCHKVIGLETASFVGLLNDFHGVKIFKIPANIPMKTDKF